MMHFTSTQYSNQAEPENNEAPAKPTPDGDPKGQ